MSVVVDASAAYDLLTEGRLVSKIADAELVAPDIVVAEIFNACWKVARVGLATATRDRIFEVLERIRLLPILPYASEAADLAESLDHPIYDCLYVAVARREGGRLLTADQRLTRKLKAKKMGGILL